MRATRRVLLGALLLSAAACQPPAWDSGGATVGPWGGDHIRVEVVANGATVEYDCARGTIDEPIVIGKGAHFSARGTYTFEHRSSRRGDDPADRHPARYSGRMVGDVMELTVTVTDKRQRFGTFMLFLRHPAHLVKCL
jgi:hypothetical protein